MAVSDIMLAARLNDQAELFKEQGRYAEAEPLYRQALAICAKTRGLDHPSVALGLTDLAELYGLQGRYAEAEPLCKRALATWKKSPRAQSPRSRAIAERSGQTVYRPEPLRRGRAALQAGCRHLLGAIQVVQIAP